MAIKSFAKKSSAKKPEKYNTRDWSCCQGIPFPATQGEEFLIFFNTMFIRVPTANQIARLIRISSVNEVISSISSTLIEGSVGFPKTTTNETAIRHR
jgi:hypothetical protein